MVPPYATPYMGTHFSTLATQKEETLMSIFTNGGAPCQEALTALLNALVPVETEGDTCRVMAIAPRGITADRNLHGAWQLIGSELSSDSTTKDIREAQFALIHKALTDCTTGELAEALTESPVEGSWDWWCIIYDTYLAKRLQGRGKSLEDTRRHIMEWAGNMERSNLLEHLTHISDESI